MIYLLDTNAFLWFVVRQKDLSANAETLIESSDSYIYLSLVSIWELAIKFKTVKLDLIPPPFSEWIDRELTVNSFRLLPINFSHVKLVAELPLVHRDPFDRLIVAQAQVERLPVISSDKVLDNYQIDRIW